ncbi:hypothetical protein BS78_07G219100 [Paspalum vaginatum]|nr:hypothetical protein BS78_07G219100 [Paspalum vaginatum]
METPRPVTLAEFCGDLVLVELVKGDPRLYHVFRWNLLFLSGDHRFVGCLGPHHKGVQGGSIYIPEAYRDHWCKYSLEDGSFDRFDAKSAGRSGFSSLIWIFPSMR